MLYKNVGQGWEVWLSIEKLNGKKELRRIDWNIVERLLVLLHYSTHMKKTNIAMKCNLSYDRCMMYLRWMEMIGLVKRSVEDGFEVISLKEKGKELCLKMVNTENTICN